MEKKGKRLIKSLKYISPVVILFLALVACARVPAPAPVQPTTATSLPASIPPPIADFAANPTEGQEPLTVTFTALTMGEVTRWQWDFGDGQSSNEQKPSHKYASAGEHTVSLTVTGPGGSNTKTKVACIKVGRAIIDWKDAASYIGQNRVVAGVIVGTHYAANTRGKPTFLNFNKLYKGHFSCLIWDSDRAKFVKQFPPNPETYFLGKSVLVRGLIEEYPKGSGVPEIVLKEPSQIEIVEK